MAVLKIHFRKTLAHHYHHRSAILITEQHHKQEFTNADY
jgi:hypothetical protein